MDNRSGGVGHDATPEAYRRLTRMWPQFSQVIQYFNKDKVGRYEPPVRDECAQFNCASVKAVMGKQCGNEVGRVDEYRRQSVVLPGSPVQIVM